MQIKFEDKRKDSIMISSKHRIKPKKSNTEEEKLRVLCLHGYRQNGNTFKSKIGAFRKHNSKYAEFVFLSAPHIVQLPKTGESSTAENVKQEGNDTPTTTNDAKETESSRSWWFNSDDRTFKGTNKNGPAYGFDETMRAVEQAWELLGPFHGILGFSQGACLVGLICNLSLRGMTKIKPQFAVLAAGFRSGSLAHANYYEELIAIPSLHIMGESDEIIPIQMSKSLATCFEEPTIVEHLGGHYFAATTQQRPHYVDFFEKRLIEHLEQKELEREEDVVVVDPLDCIPSTSAADLSDDSD